MRSFSEIRFRLKQELTNLWHLAVPPRPGSCPAGVAAGVLPEGSAVAAALAGSLYAEHVRLLAETIAGGSVPIFADQVRMPDPPAWRRDLIHGRETDLRWFRRIPYLDFRAVGDHKVIWELNRHQHLAVLAQAWLFDPRPVFLDRLAANLTSWLDQNPYGRGINWTSALEVAFRAITWVWILHWTGDALPLALRRRLIAALYGHGVYLETNLSVYFSPNTHLLGEAVALFFVGTMLPELPRANRWRRIGADLVERQMSAQVRPDGSHFEQSAYYHVYSVDFFLLYLLTAEASGRAAPAEYVSRLEWMAGYLHALLGPGREIARIGDDDGGRLFFPFGDRGRFGRATLAACAARFNRGDWPAPPGECAEIAAWWLGPHVLERSDAGRAHRESRLFADSGVTVLAVGQWQAVIDTRSFGTGGAGHSHAAALNVIVRRGETEALIDPGTFTYVSDAAARDRFRSTAVHNTVTIDGLDQATPAGPFRWRGKPSCELIDWQPDTGRVRASVSYRGFRHERTIQLTAAELRVVDRVDGPPGDHTIVQTWHMPADGGPLRPRGDFESAPALRSRCFGSEEPSLLLTRSVRGRLPATIESVFDLSPPD